MGRDLLPPLALHSHLRRGLHNYQQGDHNFLQGLHTPQQEQGHILVQGLHNFQLGGYIHNFQQGDYREKEQDTMAILGKVMLKT